MVITGRVVAFFVSRVRLLDLSLVVGVQGGTGAAWLRPPCGVHCTNIAKTMSTSDSAKPSQSLSATTILWM